MLFSSLQLFILIYFITQYDEKWKIFWYKKKTMRGKTVQMNPAGGGNNREVLLLKHVFALTLSVCIFIEVVV